MFKAKYKNPKLDLNEVIKAMHFMSPARISLLNFQHHMGHKYIKDPAKHLLPNRSYMFKVSNKNIRIRCEICSGVFIVNFEHISQLVPVFLLLTLSR